jgi:outer membrane protein, heavy metal efflux system
MTPASRQCLTILSTIAGSMFLVAGCASNAPVSRLPQTSVHAPAELVEPHVPKGAPTNPSTTTPVSLDQLLIWADAHAPVIQTAKARVGLADASVVEANLVFPANPELGIGAGARTVGGATGFDFEVSIRQQLEIAGEPGLRRDAAQAERREAKALVNEVRWTVHVEVHRLYFEVLIAAERHAQAERFVAFSQSLREIAQRQVAAGESSPLVLLVADADLARTRELLIQTSQLDAALRTRLAAIIGWPTGTLPALDGNLPPVRRAPDAPSLLSLMAEHHPAIRTRELAVLARQARLALERREAWPEPTLGVAYGRESAPGPETGANLWMLNLSVPMPLWRTNQAGKARAQAELLVADGERTQAVTRLRSELVQTAIALNAAVDRVELYDTGVVPQLEKNLALLRRAYELGEVDIHQLSQTHQRLLDAMSQYLDARTVYFETNATLEGLLGTELWSGAETSR